MIDPADDVDSIAQHYVHSVNSAYRATWQRAKSTAFKQQLGQQLQSQQNSPMQMQNGQMQNGSMQMQNGHMQMQNGQIQMQNGQMQMQNGRGGGGGSISQAMGVNGVSMHPQYQRPGSKTPSVHGSEVGSLSHMAVNLNAAPAGSRQPFNGLSSFV